MRRGQRQATVRAGVSVSLVMGLLLLLLLGLGLGLLSAPAATAVMRTVAERKLGNYGDDGGGGNDDDSSGGGGGGGGGGGDDGTDDEDAGTLRMTGSSVFSNVSLASVQQFYLEFECALAAGIAAGTSIDPATVTLTNASRDPASDYITALYNMTSTAKDDADAADTVAETESALWASFKNGSYMAAIVDELETLGIDEGEPTLVVMSRNLKAESVNISSNYSLAFARGAGGGGGGAESMAWIIACFVFGAAILGAGAFAILRAPEEHGQGSPKSVLPKS